MIYIYTGDGKGKTSAAIGLLTRARGAGLTSAIVFFDKNPDYCNELGSLKLLGVEAYIFGVNRMQEDGFRFGNIEEDLKEAKNALDTAKKILEEDVQVLVLDEILNAVRLGQLELEDVLSFLDSWPKKHYLVLTGRGLPIEIKKKADLITEALQIKHPFNSEEVLAQPGIDY